MSAHDHSEHVGGCFRCDLSRDEASTGPVTLTEFLLDRIAEDESEAQAQAAQVDAFKARVVGARQQAGDDADTSTYVDLDDFARPAYPTRALAECEAKRRIVERRACDNAPDCGDHDCMTIDEDRRILAAVYADHPDYDEAWRP